MTALSNFLEGALVAHIFGGATYTPPAGIYVALFTDDPAEGGTGTEVSGNAYVRKQFTFTTLNSTASNASTVEWPAATGAGWGTITHVALYDAVSGGNLLFYGALTTPRTVSTGDIFRIVSGELEITFN